MDPRLDRVTASSPRRYRAFGVEFSSDLDLPAPAAKGSALPAPVRIRLGVVPHSLSGAAQRTPGYEAAPGQLLLTIEGVARYWVRGGREILVCPERGAQASSVLLFLTGSAVGALLHQRGLLPLHASAVRIAGGCVAFVGRRGAGKSTLAAALYRRGHPVLCDDVLPIETSVQARAAAWPGFSRLKLCPDALRLLDVPTATRRPVGDPQRKHELELQSAPSDKPLPVRRIYVLCDSNRDKAATTRPADRTERLTTLLDHTYRFEFLEGLGLLEQHFRACARVLDGMSICRLTAAEGLSRLDETIDFLEEDFATLARSPTPCAPAGGAARS